MQNNSPIVGIDLLKMLMLQLYSNPRCIFREYIQNSLDAINVAVKDGILSQLKDGRVSISISKDDIIIEDNGVGIQSSMAVKILTDIANSIKNGVDTAGQFGVGRLSGGGYCETLEFETTYAGEQASTIVSLDIVKLRKMLENKASGISADAAMEQICAVSTIPANASDHGFTVRLKKVVNSRDILLNVEEIHKYIKEYAPVDYSTVFNALINDSGQKEFVARHKQVEHVRVSLNDYSDIEKGYSSVVVGSGDIIDKIRYFELPPHPKFGHLGWGWYAVTEFSVQINEEKDSCAGIRLRKHNISLDKNILDSCFREARGNKYFYGELFITNDNIVPDSGRQGLAASEEADALIASFRQFASGTLHNVYHKASKLKTSLAKIKETVGKLKLQEFQSAKVPLSKQLHERDEEFKRSIANVGADEYADVASLYVAHYNNEVAADVSSILSSLDSTSSVENIILKSVIAEKQENNVQAKLNYGDNANEKIETSNRLNTNVSADNNNLDSLVVQNDTMTQKSKSAAKQSDMDRVIDVLNKKSYNANQIELMKRLFGTMLVVCPSTQKKNVMQYIEIAVNSLPTNK